MKKFYTARLSSISMASALNTRKNHKSKERIFNFNRNAPIKPKIFCLICKEENSQKFLSIYLVHIRAKYWPTVSSIFQISTQNKSKK